MSRANLERPVQTGLSVYTSQSTNSDCNQSRFLLILAEPGPTLVRIDGYANCWIVAHRTGDGFEVLSYRAFVRCKSFSAPHKLPRMVRYELKKSCKKQPVGFRR